MLSLPSVGAALKDHTKKGEGERDVKGRGSSHGFVFKNVSFWNHDNQRLFSHSV